MKNSTLEVISTGDKQLNKEDPVKNFQIASRRHSIKVREEIFQEMREKEITKEQFLFKLVDYYKKRQESNYNVTSIKIPWFQMVLMDLECTYGGNFHNRSDLMRFLILDHFKEHWAFDFLKKNGHAQDLLMAEKEIASGSK